MTHIFIRWKEKIRNSRTVRKIIWLSKKLVLPGFSGLTLYQVIKFTWSGLSGGKITHRAAAISFRVLLSLPPLLIVLLTLIPFIPIADFQDNLLMNISKTMPETAFNMVEQTLNDLLTKKKQTLISISFILAVFYASNAFQAILDGFSASIHVQKSESTVIQYARSLGLMVVFSLAMIIGVALITFSSPVLNYLQELNIIGSDLIVLLIEFVKWIVVIIIFEVAISLLYRAGHTGKWKAINAGASFATLGFIIVSSLFAWFVNNFATYNKLYGSVGTLLVIMLWFYFNTIVLLIGFEINAAVAQAKGQEVSEIEPDDVMPR